MSEQNSPSSAKQPKANVQDNLHHNIDAEIHGDISGRVAVGSHILQLGSVHGGIVNINPAKSFQLQERPTPVFLRPRPFSNLIGRRKEIKVAIETLRKLETLEIYGESGIGKTILLRCLAYSPEITTLFPDGVIYLSVHRKPIADTLEDLFDAFFEIEPSQKPTQTQIRHALRNIRALILLDDVRIARHKWEELTNLVPSLTFLLASRTQSLGGEGDSIFVQGIGFRQSLELIGLNLGRKLDNEEIAVAQLLYEKMNGNPLRILRAIKDVKEGKCSFSEIVCRHEPTYDSEQYSPIDTRFQVLYLLAVVGEIGLGAKHIAAITRQKNIRQVLSQLEQKNFIQFWNNRYRIASFLMEPLKTNNHIRFWTKNTLIYFTNVALKLPSSSQFLIDEEDVFSQVLDMAAAYSLWKEILFFSRHTESLWAYSKRWGMWEHVLKLGLQAARKIGNKSCEALMLHQLGSRAICLRDNSAAQKCLKQAIHIREKLGDSFGASVSRDNLRLVLAILAGSTAVLIGSSQAAAGVTGSSATALSTLQTTTTLAQGVKATSVWGVPSASFSLTNLLKLGATVVVTVGTVLTIQSVAPDESSVDVSPKTSSFEESSSRPLFEVASPDIDGAVSRDGFNDQAVQSSENQLSPKQTGEIEENSESDSNVRREVSSVEQPTIPHQPNTAQPDETPLGGGVNQQADAQSNQPSQLSPQSPRVNPQEEQSENNLQDEPPIPIDDDVCAQLLHELALADSETSLSSEHISSALEDIANSVNSNLRSNTTAQEHDVTSISPEYLQNICAGNIESLIP